jgi:ABC-type polysaccharide/polyol phosphate export permease
LALFLILAFAIGTSIGFAIHRLSQVFPAVKLAAHVALPVIAVTSGVYQSYSAIPAQVQPYVAYNPLAPVVEYSRRALSPHYNVYNLNIYYSILFATVGIILVSLSAYRNSIIGAQN